MGAGTRASVGILWRRSGSGDGGEGGPARGKVGGGWGACWRGVLEGFRDALVDYRNIQQQ